MSGDDLERIAVFVDAGYLFAQGSACLYGSKVARVDLSLSSRAVVEELEDFAKGRAPGCTLLRIYWYDGTLAGSQLTSDQALIADLDNIKVRLGFINNQGQQKGVDSLIVTDLIELARQKAISDAVLVSGDEDVRIGVQIAQNHGVRVHLLGLHPARGSQSRPLRQEADTTFEWDAVTIAKFLTRRATLQAKMAESSSSATLDAEVGRSLDGIIEQCVAAFVTALSAADITAIVEYRKHERGVPQDFDRKLLVELGQILQRRLLPAEVKKMRSLFGDQVSIRSADM